MEPYHKQVYILIMLPMLVFISIPFRMFIARRFIHVVPPKLFWITIAILVGLLMGYVESLQPYINVPRLSPISMLCAYIPIFVISTVYQMDHFELIRCIPQAMITSVGGIVVHMSILGIVFVYLLHPGWTFIEGLIAAWITFPLEPYHIVQTLKELAKYKYLGTLLDTEAIFTLLPTVVLFELLLGIHDRIITKWYQVLMVTMRFIVGSVIIGSIFGKIQAVILSWMYNRPSCSLLVFVSMTYFLFYFCKEIVDTSGTVAITIAIAFTVVEKHRFTKRTDAYIKSFWRTLHYLADVGILMLSTVNVTTYIIELVHLDQFYRVVILYITGTSSRFLRYFMISPILSRMNYEINFRCLLVLAWSDSKGTLNMNLLLIWLANENLSVGNETFLTEILIYIVLSQYINTLFIKLLLKLVGFSDLSSVRRLNMNNCLQFIKEKQTILIYHLKMNHYLAGADWKLIASKTKLTHPYKRENEKIQEEIDLREIQKRFPECLKDVPYDVSEKELADFLKEANLNILKTKKILIIKQHEAGFIGKRCLEIIVHNLEVMIDSSAQQEELDMLLKYLTKNKLMTFLTKVVSKLCVVETLTPPVKTFRRFCFYVVMHVAYEFVIFGIIVVNVFITLSFQVIAEHNMFDRLAYHTGCCAIFFLEFVFKLTAFSHKRLLLSGFKPYLKNKWNIFEFILLCFGVLNCLLIPTKVQHCPWIQFHVVPTFCTVGVIRLLYFFRVISNFCAQITKHIEYKIDCRVSFGYEMAAALAHCDEEILMALPQIIEKKLIRDVYMKQITEERLMLIKQLESVQRERPWISITVKTRQAIRTAHVMMDQTLHELRNSGFIDEIEYAISITQLLKKSDFLRKMIFLHACNPKFVFNEVPWMPENEDIVEFLYHKVKTVSWDVGQTVYHPGKKSKGIYIIVTGMLRLIYIPRDDDYFKKNGIIPIVDYLGTTEFDKPIDDIIMSGGTIGEKCFLTGRPYDCSIKAESPSQAYWLGVDVLKEAMAMCSDPVNGLEARIWKNGVFNLAIALIMSGSMYESFTRDQIKLKLKKSFVPNLATYQIFLVTDLMDDVLLIEGTVIDFATGETLTAPMLLPRNIKKIKMTVTQTTFGEYTIFPRLLIIPIPDATPEEIMANLDAMDELTSVSSDWVLMPVKQSLSNLLKTETKTAIHDEALIFSMSSSSMYSYEWRDDKEIITLDQSESVSLEEVKRLDESSASDLSEVNVFNLLRKNRSGLEVVRFSASSSDGLEPLNADDDFKPIDIADIEEHPIEDKAPDDPEDNLKLVYDWNSDFYNTYSNDYDSNNEYVMVQENDDDGVEAQDGDELRDDRKLHDDVSNEKSRDVLYNYY